MKLDQILTSTEIAALKRTRERLTALIEQHKPIFVDALKAAHAVGAHSTRWIDDYRGMAHTVNALDKLLGKE